jgi:hypothetical protein
VGSRCHPERTGPAFSPAPLFGAPGRAERDLSSSLRLRISHFLNVYLTRPR